jgi:hypothetical protein
LMTRLDYPTMKKRAEGRGGGRGWGFFDDNMRKRRK